MQKCELEVPNHVVLHVYGLPIEIENQELRKRLCELGSKLDADLKSFGKRFDHERMVTVRLLPLISYNSRYVNPGKRYQLNAVQIKLLQGENSAQFFIDFEADGKEKGKSRINPLFVFREDLEDVTHRLLAEELKLWLSITRDSFRVAAREGKLVAPVQVVKGPSTPLTLGTGCMAVVVDSRGCKRRSRGVGSTL